MHAPNDVRPEELGNACDAAHILILPKLLRAFRDALVIEQADRPRIADELRGKARVS